MGVGETKSKLSIAVLAGLALALTGCLGTPPEREYDRHVKNIAIKAVIPEAFSDPSKEVAPDGTPKYLNGVFVNSRTYPSIYWKFLGREDDVTRVEFIERREDKFSPNRSGWGRVCLEFSPTSKEMDIEEIECAGNFTRPDN